MVSQPHEAQTVDLTAQTATLGGSKSEQPMKTVKLLYGTDGIELVLPDSAVLLQGRPVSSLPDADQAVIEALAHPISSPPLAELIRNKRPQTVAVTISDITRPVPNKQFLPAMLRVINSCGVADSQIVIIIGTGMHRASTPKERELLVGRDILGRIEVIDHLAAAPDTLVGVSDDPPVSLCRRFAQAEFRIVTGYIEPHFMAGFSGGRKGLCPALVDLETVQRFHGFETLANPNADNGNLDGNPCHEIASKIAAMVGVDFLFNVAITHDRRIANHQRRGLSPRPDFLPDRKGHVHRHARPQRAFDSFGSQRLHGATGQQCLHQSDAQMGPRLARLPDPYRQAPR